MDRCGDRPPVVEERPEQNGRPRQLDDAVVEPQVLEVDDGDDVRVGAQDVRRSVVAVHDLDRQVVGGRGLEPASKRPPDMLRQVHRRSLEPALDLLHEWDRRRAHTGCARPIGAVAQGVVEAGQRRAGCVDLCRITDVQQCSADDVLEPHRDPVVLDLHPSVERRHRGGNGQAALREPRRQVRRERQALEPLRCDRPLQEHPSLGGRHPGERVVVTHHDALAHDDVHVPPPVERPDDPVLGSGDVREPEAAPQHLGGIGAFPEHLEGHRSTLAGRAGIRYRSPDGSGTVSRRRSRTRS